MKIQQQGKLPLPAIASFAIALLGATACKMQEPLPTDASSAIYP